MAENKKRWITCPNCEHKLFEYDGGRMAMKIKCSSCKIVISMLVTDKGVVYGESKT